ncbi:MAG TPA: PQQ-binding-like beta-propeller repeat protein [Steroidobacteraceae bacterium]|nr:PQQ-binding-like beta-propeller repeat protein [Steroidobacteraceae bacterium]
MRTIKRLALTFVAAVVVIALIAFAGSLVSPGVAWRTRLVREKLTGQIPQIPLPLLVKWMAPNSAVSLYHLSETPNVNASIQNQLTDSASAAAGAKTFGNICASCHGAAARGGVGPNLVAAISSLTDWQFLSTVKWGRPGTLMRGQPLSATQIWQIDAFIRQMALDSAVGKKYTVAAPPPYSSVTAQMLDSVGESGDWLSYDGDMVGTRHSPLGEITPANVRDLQMAWVAQLPTDGTDEEASPIVVGPWMFVTEPPEGVTALDAGTGKVLWQFHRPLPPVVAACCGEPNRGVAVFGNNVYVATFDAHLLALSATTGAVVWDEPVADWHENFSMTSAPLVADGRLVVGVAGGDFGARGFIAAYSAESGALLWRWNTVPGPGEPGHETWAGDSWKRGGASTWLTGAYDPALGLVYWGTGNPAEVYNGKFRAGDNLYSDSIVALDVRTGKLRWYFQFTPHDSHGWDSTEQPVLADIPYQGRTVQAVLFANRNGFYYVLDRRTGQFLFARAFAKQTWASGMTASGRPIVVPGSEPTPTGNPVSPPTWGATSWWPPSFDAQRNVLYVPAVDSFDTFFNVDNDDYHPGRPFLGSGFVRDPDRPTTLALRAIDASTGQLRWDSTIEIGGGEVPGEMGGVLSTAGGLVFAGHESEFDAYDADSGKLVWNARLGGVIHAAPISYSASGRQYVAVMSGRDLFVFGVPHDEEASTAAPPRAAQAPHGRKQPSSKTARRRS